MTRPHSPLSDQAPWITYKAIIFLETLLKPTMSVHEWGSGGSTIFFAKRCKKVTTIEHDRVWHGIVQKEIKRLRLSNAKLLLVPPGKPVKEDNKNSLLFLSSMVAGSFQKYCQKIEGEHDVVMVDGRARPGCVITGFKHVKPGGFLILDNAERALYANAVKHMNNLGWTAHNWRGLGAYSYGVETLTKGWQRPV